MSQNSNDYPRGDVYEKIKYKAVVLIGILYRFTHLCNAERNFEISAKYTLGFICGKRSVKYQQFYFYMSVDMEFTVYEHLLNRKARIC